VKKYELSIDTSTDTSSVALSLGGEVVAELTWRVGASHTVQLVPSVDYLLRKINATPQELRAVFVAKGPGSFNGLRVGMSAAKGFAFALSIPIVGISTLEVEAYAFAHTGLPICAMHGAGRGELAVAFYQQADGWRCLKGEHLITPEALCQQIERRTLFCGELSTHVIEVLKARLGELALIAEPVARLRRAGYLAALGWQRLEEGRVDDPVSLQPIYMRPPPITQRKVK
jgi:tRNA threonylcarbamoyl adenosine modification protein YeaZ